MKSTLTLMGLMLGLMGNVVTPAFAAEQASKSAQSAKLTELKQQLAVTDQQIATLKAKKAAAAKHGAQIGRDKSKNQTDSISELGQEDTLQLQRAMEQKAQLETMISNVMKAESDASSSIANAKKS